MDKPEGLVAESLRPEAGETTARESGPRPFDRSGRRGRLRWLARERTWRDRRYILCQRLSHQRCASSSFGPRSDDYLPAMSITCQQGGEFITYVAAYGMEAALLSIVVIVTVLLLPMLPSPMLSARGSWEAADVVLAAEAAEVDRQPARARIRYVALFVALGLWCSDPQTSGQPLAHSNLLFNADGPAEKCDARIWSPSFHAVTRRR
jgi:hypothetical protein